MAQPQLWISIGTALSLLASCAGKTPHVEQPPPPAIAPASPAAQLDKHTRHVPDEHDDPVSQVDATDVQASHSSNSNEQEAYERAKPVFQKYCSKCHTEQTGKRTALKHFVMDSYPFGGHHTANMPSTIRKVLGQDGKRATMPRDKPGIVQGDELNLVLEWADAAERAHTAAPTSEHESP